MPRRLARRSPELRDIDEHMRGTGRMVRHGHARLWGAGRHSSGDNVYSYFAGPDNFVVEYTTALERISDEDAWVPRIWPASPEYADRWGTAGPGEDLFALWHTARRRRPGSGCRRRSEKLRL